MQNIFSIASLRANQSQEADCIVIPEYIFNTLVKLCDSEKEYAGYLVCFGNVVEYPFLAGSGTSGSVYPKKRIVFSDPNNYSIEFHTHPSILGDHWAQNFSDGDITSFNNRVLQEGREYNHILFTSKNVLTWGVNQAPVVRIGFGNTQQQKLIFKKRNDKYKQWKI